jgi:hypothetical protein
MGGKVFDWGGGFFTIGGHIGQRDIIPEFGNSVLKGHEATSFGQQSWQISVVVVIGWRS